MDPPATPSASKRNDWLLPALVFVLALLLRMQFVHQAVVEQPLSGDTRNYVAYAINLYEHGTFSKAVPGEPVIADSYRSPGYPLFLAACMEATHGVRDDLWYHLALAIQCLLGAATALLALFIALEWLPRAAALGVGLAVAMWPHHVVASSALLLEVLLGFVLALALLLTARAFSRRSRALATVAGATLAFATLVNPAMLFLPLAFAVTLLRGGRARLFLPFILLPLLGWAGWAWRDAHVPMPDSTGRGALNFVQGSWPGMHEAWKNSRVDPEAAFTLAKIDYEAQLLEQHPREGFSLILARMASSPGAYVRWYLFEKPFLLWDWDIRVGAGGIYVNAIDNSPFERNPVLRGMSEGLRLANPLLFVLALAGLVACALRARRDADAIAPALVGLAFAYFTAIHDIFQAEPRYAIAYRPVEFLLVAAAIVAVASWRRTRVVPIVQPGQA